ncbi:MAG TPA: saccharopine dehydrogenase C-terminal domain-containing protein [Burkholderiales bacterium]|jgi:homospermidine synthase
MAEHKKHVAFKGKLLMIGFGAVGQGTLPLILRHIDMPKEKIKIITADDWGRDIAEGYGVAFAVEPLVRDNYLAILDRELRRGDFLFNASFDVSSLALIEYCSERGIMYLDACIEPWAGGHRDTSMPAARRTNYAFREAALEIGQRHPKGATCVVMHGANPGLVSHFVKQALLNIARDTRAGLPEPATREQWGRLAMQLGVKTVQIAERDRQVGSRRKEWGEFVNTWSSGAFVGESLQPAELGWGTHEKHWPREGMEFGFGCGSSIYLNRPGCTTRVRSWVPTEGPFHGWLISHGETHSIPDYFTVRENGRAIYRPTCYYAYHPCDDAVLSLHEMVGHNFSMQERTRLLREEITDGIDELGVLLMGHARGAYWYGSQLSIHEARQLCPHNNATSLQVNAPALGAVVWAMRNPAASVVEPDDLDFRTVLEVAMPYLGPVVGVYSDWTPLVGRAKLYPEDVDWDDPWQFKNFLVT